MSPVPRAVLTATASTVLAVGAASLVAPEWLGLAGTRPWLYAASMRVPVVAGLGAAAAVAGIAAAARRRTWGRALRPAAAVLAVAAAAGGAVVLSRGAGAGHLPPAQEGDVTVVTANTLFSRADRAAVVDLVLRSGADVVTMPETTRAYAEDVAAGVLAAGGPALQVFAQQEGPASNSSTALLVSDRWGPYRQLPREELAMELGAVAAVPVSGDGPPVAAVHPHAPVGARLPVGGREAAAAGRCAAAGPGAFGGAG